MGKLPWFPVSMFHDFFLEPIQEAIEMRSQDEPRSIRSHWVSLTYHILVCNCIDSVYFYVHISMYILIYIYILILRDTKCQAINHPKWSHKINRHRRFHEKKRLTMKSFPLISQNSVVTMKEKYSHHHPSKFRIFFCDNSYPSYPLEWHEWI